MRYVWFTLFVAATLLCLVRQFDVVARDDLDVYSYWDYYTLPAPEVVGRLSAGQRADILMIHHSFEDLGFTVRMPDGRSGYVASMLSGDGFRIALGLDPIACTVYGCLACAVFAEQSVRGRLGLARVSSWLSLNIGSTLAFLIALATGVL